MHGIYTNNGMMKNGKVLIVIEIQICFDHKTM